MWLITMDVWLSQLTVTFSWWLISYKNYNCPTSSGCMLCPVTSAGAIDTQCVVFKRICKYDRVRRVGLQLHCKKHHEPLPFYYGWSFLSSVRRGQFSCYYDYFITSSPPQGEIREPLSCKLAIVILFEGWSDPQGFLFFLSTDFFCDWYKMVT